MLFEQFWLERGPLALPAMGRDDDGAARRFVLTASVRGQLHNLARCILARRHPILLQVGLSWIASWLPLHKMQHVWAYIYFSVLFAMPLVVACSTLYVMYKGHV